MFRGALLSQHRLVLLTLTVSAAASPGFWSNIYQYEAPPPDQGPPLSASALRDKSKLPWEICGIVGAYLATVLVALTLLITVGRRMRRDAEMSPLTLEIEMVKAGQQAFDVTPISPASTTRSWFHKTFKRTPSVKSGMSSPTSPAVQSVASFDHVVLQSDKERRQKEMERLYAAVMEHQDEQEARKSQTTISEAGSVDQGGRQPRRPLEINTTAKLPENRYPSPQSTTSPRSFSRPTYAMESPRVARFSEPQETLSPRSAMVSPRKDSTASPAKQPLSPLSPRNFLSRSRQSSVTSSPEKSRKSLKNIRISAPIQRYPGDMDDEARTPLSPRFYDPPPPPALPSATGSYAATPGTAGTMDSAYAREARDEVQPLPIPRANPLRSPMAPPPQLTLSPAKSAASSASSLPLRSYHDQQGFSAVPPTPTKLTYVERRKDKLSLTTPRTGVPGTPYSPYMPFTPITPVTPRLVTKKERKERKKMEGKRVMTDDDMVRDEEELW